MSNHQLISSISFFCLILCNASCTKENENALPEIKTEAQSTDNNNTSSTGEEKLVSYELTGDFSGKVDVTFLSSNVQAPDQVIGITLPWNFNYTVPGNTQAIGGFANGLYGDANIGETTSLKMFLDERLIETVIRTSNENSYITMPIEVYNLEFDDLQKTISEENIGMDVSYKIEGNYSGKLTVVYKVADGSRENIEIHELPWIYSFKTSKNSNKVGIYGFGNGGLENEEIIFSLRINNQENGSENVLTDKEGVISLSPEIFTNLD